MAWFSNGATRMTAPDIQWFAEKENETYYTPDVNMLEQRPWQNLFLFGEDRPDLGKNMAKMEDDILDSPVVAFTRQHFSMYRKELGGESYPIALERKFAGNDHTCIKGYVVTIRSSKLYELDNYRENGKLFIRKRVKLIIPYTRIQWVKETTEAKRGGNQTVRAYKHVKAHMYVGNPDYWDCQIDAGYIFSPVNRIVSQSPWMEDYIYYDPPPF